MSEVGHRVKTLLAAELGVDADTVSENAPLVQDLGVDGLDQAGLVMACEQEFGCLVPDNVAEELVTVADLINFFERTARLPFEAAPVGHGIPEDVVVLLDGTGLGLLSIEGEFSRRLRSSAASIETARLISTLEILDVTFTTRDVHAVPSLAASLVEAGWRLPLLVIKGRPAADANRVDELYVEGRLLGFLQKVRAADDRR